MVDTNTTVGNNDAHSNTVDTTTTAMVSNKEIGTRATEQEPTHDNERGHYARPSGRERRWLTRHTTPR